MDILKSELRVSTADAEDVRMRHEEDALWVAFRDWQDREISVVFRGVLGFRWQECDETVIRDDMTYEVVNSPWLGQQARLQSVNASDYTHHKLCFNACGMIDVLARSVDQENVSV
jgi:hypothetical protein